MPRPSRPWFRFYVETTRDMKIRHLSPTQRWLWVAILSAARESPIPGHLMLSQSLAMSELMLSQYAAVRVQDVRCGLKLMMELGLVEESTQYGCWMVPRWSERQFESDDVAIRTRKHRSREQDRNVPGNRIVTDQIQRQNTETDTDVSLRKPRKRATGVPERFEITDGLRGWVKENGFDGIDLENQTQLFLDHHAAKGSTYADWNRAWQTWIRNRATWDGERSTQPTTSSPYVTWGARQLPPDDDDGEDMTEAVFGTTPQR